MLRSNLLMDFDVYETNERNGSFGGQAGSKEAITIDGEYWIIKYPKNTKGMRTPDISYTTSPLSEFIGSHVYDILGYDVHETRLGIRNGKVVVACKDFCKKEGSLREIRVLKNTYNKKLEELLDESFSSTNDKIVDLEELMIHMDNNPILKDIPGLKQRFWNCVIIDGLINNNDRNNGNWGLLYEDGKYMLSPVYDNGAAFSNKLSDDRIKKRLENIQDLRQGILATETAYGINDKKLKFKDILELDIPEMREALMRNISLITNRFPQIEAFIQDIPEEFNGLPIISQERKAFYIEGMKLRMEEIILPCFKKIK